MYIIRLMCYGCVGYLLGYNLSWYGLLFLIPACLLINYILGD